jgi:hypothetical protein
VAKLKHFVTILTNPLTFHNIMVLSWQGIVNPLPNPTQEDHHLLAVCHSLFNIFMTTPISGGPLISEQSSEKNIQTQEGLCDRRLHKAVY